MKSLFDRVQIGKLILQNRFVRSATWERMADERGDPTEELFSVYEALAKGEIGMIITGLSSIIKEEKPLPRMMGIYENSLIKTYRRLTGMVQKLGGKIIMQIGYGGTRTGFPQEGSLLWGPSSIPEYSTGIIAKEMTLEDIQILLKAFGDAAKRAKESGFDGVQLHAGHGYLLGQFLCPYHNHRLDKYGGSVTKRARIILEAYDMVRQKVGSFFPVMIKLNTEDYIEEGATIEDSLFVCKELVKMGIDAIELSGGIYPFSTIRHVESEIEEGYFAESAAKIAKEVEVPVVLVGGLRSPSVMEWLLRETDIECFAMSRPFLAEPQLVKRWKSGDKSKARCLSCNQCKTDEGNFCNVYRKDKGKTGAKRVPGEPLAH